MVPRHPDLGGTTRRSSPSVPLASSPYSPPNASSRRQSVQPTTRASLSSRLGAKSTTTNADSAAANGEREFSSRDRKTKRAAFYRGRSASPLPRPPEWLATPSRNHRNARSPSPTRASGAGDWRWRWKSQGHQQQQQEKQSSRPIRHPALVPSARHNNHHNSSSHSSSHSHSPILARKRMFYTDTRFFLVYALENSIRLRLLSIEGEKGDELRASGALGWSGSRAVRMVRRERVRSFGARAGAGVRSLLSEGSFVSDEEDEDED